MGNYETDKARLEQLVIIKRELLKRSLEDSFHKFVKWFFELLNPSEQFVDNWHIKYICSQLERLLYDYINNTLPEDRHLIINIPPRSLKSFIVTVAFPAWAWIKNPSLKFIGSSYSGTLSSRHNVMTKQILQTQDYKDWWGDVVGIDPVSNTQDFFKTTYNGYRTCTSTGGTVTGVGADFIMVDDPLNPKEAVSEVEREKANTYFDQTLQTRFNDPKKGCFIIVMQRLHVRDLVGHILLNDERKDKYRHICIPAELSDAVKPESLKEKYKDGLFFPDRFPQSVINDYRVALGLYGFYGQILQLPFIEGGGMVKKAWFGRFTYGSIPMEKLVWNFVADTAYTKKTTNDPTGILAYAYYENSWYIRAFASVHYEFPKLIKFIPKFARQNGYTERSRFYIEPKASGISVAQQLKKALPFNAILDDPPKEDKVTRLSAQSPKIEAGRVFLLEGASWLEMFLSEMEAFPNGLHDEAADLLSMMLKKERGSNTQKFSFYKRKK